MKRKLLIIILSILFLILFIGFWQGYKVLNEVPSFILPSPQEVGEEFISLLLNGTFLEEGWVTLYTILIGFVIGSSLGFISGYFAAKSKKFEELIMPYMLLIQATPKVSLIPLFVIWFGLGMPSKLLLIVLSAFFPVMVNTILGLRSVPENYEYLLTILGANERQRVIKLQLPMATPVIFAGLKVAMVQSVIGAIVSEWMAGERGLGYLLVYGSSQYNANLLIASIFATAFLGLALYWVIEFFERRLLFWHESKLAFKEEI
ncbi:MAG: NitT/TauT family transport system permease protein [Kosmotogales bacterium]|nr:NitT/TauT family transport system permease protein [Kosmotogales bacterium]